MCCGPETDGTATIAALLEDVDESVTGAGEGHLAVATSLTAAEVAELPGVMEVSDHPVRH